MSHFTNLVTVNANIKELNVESVKSKEENGTIQITSDINLNGNSLQNAGRLTLENYEIIEDFDFKTLAIHILGTRLKGALFDTRLNKPYEVVLPITQRYFLPDHYLYMLNSIQKNPNAFFLFDTSGDFNIFLPTLTPMSQYQNTHLRFSNVGFNFVSFFYKEEQLIQINHERVSFVWHTDNGIDYDWIHVP